MKFTVNRLLVLRLRTTGVVFHLSPYDFMATDEQVYFSIIISVFPLLEKDVSMESLFVLAVSLV